MSYDNTNKGVLFSNKRREKDTHPTHTGSINIDGVEYWLSAWVNTKRDNSGEKYFSLTVKPKDEQPQQRGSPPPSRNQTNTPRPSDFDNFDDDIPF